MSAKIIAKNARLLIKVAKLEQQLEKAKKRSNMTTLKIVTKILVLAALLSPFSIIGFCTALVTRAILGGYSSGIKLLDNTAEEFKAYRDMEGGTNERL